MGTMLAIGMAVLAVTVSDAAPPPQPAASSPDAAAVSTSVRKPFDRVAALQNPAYRAAMQAQQEIEVRIRLRDLPQWMDLTPQAHEDFVALLTRQAMESMDLKAAREQRSGKPAVPKLPSNDLRHPDEVAKFLGEKRAAVWRDYNQTSTQRKFLAAVNERLPAGEKLAPARMAGIATTMRQAERDFWTEQQQRPGSGQPGVPAAVRAVPGAQIPVANRQMADRSLAAVAPDLSPTQIDVMHALVDEMTARPFGAPPDRRVRVRADLLDFRDWVEISDSTFERLVDLGIESGMGNQSIEPVLGKEGAQLFGEWMRASGERYYLLAVNAQLPSAHALEGESRMRAAKAMAQVQKEMVRELGSVRFPDARTNPRLLAAAAPHLSPIQQQALERTLRAAVLMAEAQAMEAAGAL